MLKTFIIFTAGLSIGSVATWLYLDQKYKRMASKEIEEVREYYRNKKKSNDESKGNKVCVSEEYEKDILNRYREMTDKYKTDEQGSEVTIKKENDNMDEQIYIIDYDEFEYEKLDYDKVSLTLYNNKVLTDGMDNVIEDPDSIVGDLDVIYNRFEDFDTDTVYVRNDEKCEDFEITIDSRDFDEEEMS